MTQQPHDLAAPTRGILGVLMLVVPIVSIVLVGAAFAVINLLGRTSSAAHGAHVKIVMQGCPAAAPIIQARLNFMGLDASHVQPINGKIEVVTQLMADPTSAEGVPKVLASAGRFEIRKPTGEVVVGPDGVESATVALPFLMAAHPVITLNSAARLALRDAMRADPKGVLEYWLNGVRVDIEENMPPIENGKVILEKNERSEFAQVLFSAEAAASLTAGALPCEVQVQSVQTLAP